MKKAKQPTPTNAVSATKKKKTMALKKSAAKKILPVETPIEEVDRYEDTTEQGSSTMPNGNRKTLVLIGVIALLILGYGIYKYRYMLVPATVNGQPIYVWEYVWQMHKQFGKDQLNAMTTERMITQAVDAAKIDVPVSEIDAEVKLVEQEASASGGLQVVLDSQGISMDEFRTRLRLQLAVKKILSDKIKVSDQEVDEALKKNKDFYKGMSDAEARTQIRKQLEEQKFQQEVQLWLSDVRTKAKIEIKLPGIE